MPENDRSAVFIVCGGLFQVPAVEAAHSLGLRAIVTDANPAAPAMQIADEAVTCDIYDVEGHLAVADDVRTRWDIRGAFTEGADVEVTVAEVARHLQLPGIPVEAARTTKSKARTRNALDRAGLPGVRWREVRDPDEGTLAAEDLGFPLIAKAVDNCASRGTSRVDSPADLTRAVRHAMAASTTGTCLLEEFLVGDEQSVELLFDASGRCRRLNVVDRVFSHSDGWAIELGHVNPSKLTRGQQDELFDIVEQAADAVGVRFGAFKADTIRTSAGPRILEVTARLSGGFDCQYTTPISSGRNFIRAAMCVAVGLPIDERDLTPTVHRHAAAWAALPRPCTVDRIDGVDAARSLPGVDHVFLRVKPGDTIEPYEDCAARPAFAIAHADSWDEAAARARAAAELLRFEGVAVPLP